MGKVNLHLVAVALVLVAPLLGRGEDEQMGKTIKIGITQNNVGQDPYQSAYAKKIEDLAQQNTEVNSIILDAGGDPSRQSSQIQDLIQQKVNVIIVWPTHGRAMVLPVKKAHEQGIPVVISNSALAVEGEEYMTAYTGPNDLDEAASAARVIAKGLNYKGKIVQLMGFPGYTTSIERQVGFEEELKRVAPDIEILDSQPADWDREKGLRIMENFLLKYSEIDGVYSANGNMGVGALLASKNAGRAQGMIFVDATLYAATYDVISAGEYYGSIYQSPEADAELAFEVAIKIAQGEEVPKYNYIETPVVLKDNVTEFNRPAF